ncbi:MAG: pyridoxamine 5'-phosphate oxidase family protein [Thermoguttaceae bacterium]|nr:pyridoxamine 5'-phosphate oxidase family protein [Thermoguttaceae bacterium]
MRNADREVKNKADIISILDRCPVLHVAIPDDPAPYIVPVNYAWTWNEEWPVLYFHSATQGKKIELLMSLPQVGFEAERLIEVFKGESPCQCGAYYESIIGQGTSLPVEDALEKKAAMDLIMHRYGWLKAMEYHPATFDHMIIVKIKVSSLHAKHLLPH